MEPLPTWYDLPMKQRRARPRAPAFSTIGGSRLVAVLKVAG
jgi:hypothetical protein